jgi:predicted PurR-regulated permease PerM
MNNHNSNGNVYDTTIRLLVLLIIIVLCLMILYPFASIMLWSFILGIALMPFHRFLVNLMKGKAKLASFIVVLVCIAIIVIPGWFILNSIFKEVVELKSVFLAGKMTIPPPSENVKSWPVIGNQVYEIWQAGSTDLEKVIIKYKDQLIGIGSTIAKGILSMAGGIIQMIVSLLIAGVLLAIGGTGESVRKLFIKLAGDYGNELCDLIVKTIGSVVKGVLGEALVQATFFGIGFSLAGIPYPGLWALLIFISAIMQLPIIVITIPFCAYLFSEKDILPAILWTIYLVLAALSDNILTPMMLGKGAPVPTLVIFFGAIGGFILMGFIGLFTGAIIMAVGYQLFVTWLNPKPEVEMQK